MPILELDEAIELFSEKMEPVLTRVKYRSDNPKNFTKEQMKIFLSLAHFVNTYKDNPYLPNTEGTKRFNEFALNFYKASRKYFASKIGFGEVITKASFKEYFRIGKGNMGCKDVDFILSISKDKLPIHHLFNLIVPFDSFVASNYIKVKCTMHDIVAHMSEEKQLEFCKYLFEENKLENYLEYFDLMNMRRDRDDLVKMVLEYHNHLISQGDEGKVQKLKEQILDHFYNTFAEQIKSNINSDNKIYKQFIAEFFVKELIRKDELIDVLQKAVPTYDFIEKEYSKIEQNIYKTVYENLNDLLDYCSGIDTKQIKQELEEIYVQTSNRPNPKPLDIEKEYNIDEGYNNDEEDDENIEDEYFYIGDEEIELQFELDEKCKKYIKTARQTFDSDTADLKTVMRLYSEGYSRRQILSTMFENSEGLIQRKGDAHNAQRYLDETYAEAERRYTLSNQIDDTDCETESLSF